MKAVAAPWTDEHVSLLRELVETHSYADIGERMGRSKESVKWKLRQLGLALPPEEARRRQYMGGVEGRTSRYSQAEHRSRRLSALKDELSFWDEVEALAKDAERRGRAWVAKIIRRSAVYKPHPAP